MSVTFYGTNPDGNEIVPAGWVAEYEDDPQYGRFMSNTNPLSLNVANGNFARLMTMIGIGFEDADYCGAFGDGSLQDLIEKVQFTLASLKAMPVLDAGRPSETTQTKGGATMIECGTSDGYFTERLETLLQIALTTLAQDGTLQYN